VEKVKIFNEIILKVKNFFSKFPYFLERENFQNLKVTPLTKFSYFFESENFQNLKMIESKKNFNEITESEKYS